jgi:hypothetical protein
MYACIHTYIHIHIHTHTHTHVQALTKAGFVKLGICSEGDRKEGRKELCEQREQRGKKEERLREEVRSMGWE